MKSWQCIFIVFLVALIGFPCLIKAVGIELAENASAGDWCYDAPTCDQSSDKWMVGACKDGARQSPVNFILADMRIDDENDCPLDFGMTLEGAYNLKKYNLANRGKTVNIEPANPGDFDNSFFRWPAMGNGNYTLHSVHFHWGPDDDSGSEHTFNGRSYPLEAHLVHYRSSSYKTLKEAIESKQGNAVAVIGILMRNGYSPGILNSVTNALEKTDFYVGTALPVTVNDIPLLFGDEIKGQNTAYHYEGSLTTPNCDEVVQWIVLSQLFKGPTADIQILRDRTRQQSTFRKYRRSNGRKMKALRIAH